MPAEVPTSARGPSRKVGRLELVFRMRGDLFVARKPWKTHRIAYRRTNQIPRTSRRPSATRRGVADTQRVGPCVSEYHIGAFFAYPAPDPAGAQWCESPLCRRAGPKA